MGKTRKHIEQAKQKRFWDIVESASDKQYHHWTRDILLQKIPFWKWKRRNDALEYNQWEQRNDTRSERLRTKQQLKQMRGRYESD